MGTRRVPAGTPRQRDPEWLTVRRARGAGISCPAPRETTRCAPRVSRTAIGEIATSHLGETVAVVVHGGVINAYWRVRSTPRPAGSRSSRTRAYRGARGRPPRRHPRRRQRLLPSLRPGGAAPGSLARAIACGHGARPAGEDAARPAGLGGRAAASTSWVSTGPRTLLEGLAAIGGPRAEMAGGGPHVRGPRGDVPVRIYRPTDDVGSAARARVVPRRRLRARAASIAAISRAASCAQRSGVVVVSVDYRWRPSTRTPPAVDDCYAALAWVVGQRGRARRRRRSASPSAVTARVATWPRSSRSWPAIGAGRALRFQLLVYPGHRRAVELPLDPRQRRGLLAHGRCHEVVRRALPRRARRPQGSRSSRPSTPATSPDCRPPS